MRRGAKGCGGRQDGFTLIEVLVAFFIAALTLTAAMRVLTEGSGWARRGPAAAIRMEEALSILDTVMAAPSLGPGEQEGVFADGRGWRVRVTDITAAVLPQANGRLLRIDFFAGGGTPLLTAAAVGAPLR